MDGVAKTGFSVNTTTFDTYYIFLDVKGGNTLQIQNLSVVRTPSITFAPTPSNLSVVQGNSVSASLTAQGQNITAGTATSRVSLGSAGVAQNCPAGFSYGYYTTFAIPATGPVAVPITFYTTNLAVVGNILLRLDGDAWKCDVEQGTNRCHGYRASRQPAHYDPHSCDAICVSGAGQFRFCHSNSHEQERSYRESDDRAVL